MFTKKINKKILTSVEKETYDFYCNLSSCEKSIGIAIANKSRNNEFNFSRIRSFLEQNFADQIVERRFSGFRLQRAGTLAGSRSSVSNGPVHPPRGLPHPRCSGQHLPVPHHICISQVRFTERFTDLAKLNFSMVVSF